MQAMFLPTLSENVNNEKGSCQMAHHFDVDEKMVVWTRVVKSQQA
jgi:hypothetical protein